MTAFGGIFGTPSLDGEEESDENGERGRIRGLDLDRGVVRIRRARATSPESPASPESPEEDRPGN